MSFIGLPVDEPEWLLVYWKLAEAVHQVSVAVRFYRQPNSGRRDVIFTESVNKDMKILKTCWTSNDYNLSLSVTELSKLYLFFLTIYSILKTVF